MRSHLIRIGSLLVCTLAATLTWAQQGQYARPEIKRAQITINHRAEADGMIRVRVQPVGGASSEVTIDVQRRMGENEIADEISKALTAVLGSGYEIRRAGENVHVHRGDGAGFHLEIAFNTPGLWILLDD